MYQDLNVRTVGELLSHKASIKSPKNQNACLREHQSLLSIIGKASVHKGIESR